MRKYTIGRKVKDLEDMYSQELIIHKPHNSSSFEKVYSRGWFCGWSLRCAKMAIERGDIYTAERKVAK